MMSRPTKSLDPAERSGVFKRFGEVPERYRLHQHTDAYRGRDVWQEFCDEHEYAEGSDRRHIQEVDRVGDRWKGYMAQRGRHHALATPEDVDAWCSSLLAEYTPRRAYDTWLRVKRFYDWLEWHAEHPHAYNPVLMAAANHDDARDVWDEMATQVRRRREKYRRKNQ